MAVVKWRCWEGARQCGGGTGRRGGGAGWVGGWGLGWVRGCDDGRGGAGGGVGGSAPNTSQSILELLEIYEGFSGQKVNLNRSAIFFSHNTPQNTRLAVAQTLNIEHIGAQDKYLGLLSIVQKSKKATFGAIKDKVQKRIMGWKRSLLSSGGRHTLLRAVGEAIPIYTLSCFKLLDTLLTEIHSMLSQFWWGQKDAERRMVWIKWDTMTRPKKDGGLGIKDLRA
ncbi:uncharacterized protein [Arachis hypogaea]|uniref:uncharacterized protein n=1 Tax=Arachis hypogaea TaxID=3818 RepID=UPI000DEC0A28|nr:uncharacterized protein LOC112734091 [Arachis hypogaea]